MKIQRMKKVAVALLVTCTLFVAASFAVFAATATNSGTKNVGNGGYINWQFTSEGAGNSMTACRWNYVTPYMGVYVSGKRAYISPVNSSEAYGRVSATLAGSPVLSDSIITWHVIKNSNITCKT